ncbi:hypothetical protein [Microvirga antarctica]|uniref:hypothetical protein n=1 Tax=Microvirga antarctica TaxID=2819233 RepID=UPI001B31010C|nr:hypothetical protein [Microvirga antarctica]
MDPSREPVFTPDAGKLVGKAVGLTQAALASDAGKAVQSVIAQGPQGLMQHLSQAAKTPAHDPVTQARVLMAEQSQHFDVMRSAIGKIGASLAHINEMEPEGQHPQTTALFNAQAEAIQGLTLLILKGQQVQTELITAIDGQAARTGAQSMPKWIYYMMGAMMVWSMLGMIF